MNKLSKILLTLATVLVIGLMAIALDKSSSKTIGDSNVPNLFASATNSSVAVSASTSTTIMSFNGNRQFASVCNNGANTVYLSFNAAAVVAKGYILNSTDCFEINNTKNYTGSITGIATSSTSTVTIIEK